MTFIIPSKANTFGELCCGDLFISKRHSGNDEEQVYMKAEDIEDTYGAIFNAVNLHTGCVCNFYDNDEIEPITATLSIKRS